MSEGIRSLTVVESANLGLGQVGAIFLTDSTSISSKKIVAIQFVTDTVFTTLTPSSSSFVGSANGNGENVGSTVFPTGAVIFGQWTDIELTSGSIIAYEGNF